jgi:hypothetical protein
MVCQIKRQKTKWKQIRQNDFEILKELEPGTQKMVVSDMGVCHKKRQILG